MPPAEPLWYCHECHAEMRPLMAPDPVCASCRGSFVEKMENPEDDPREFTHANDDGHFNEDLPPPGLDTFLLTLQALMDGGMANGAARTRPDGSPAAPRLSFQIASNNGTRTMSFGGPNTLGTPPGRRTSGEHVPTATEFLGQAPGGAGPRITGPMMAQYLLALLGQRDPLSNLLATGLGGPGMAESGRMGDYVFNQEALDQIITQLMENSNAHRPIPATDEIMAKLPREILTLGSATLERDCAVCKDQFKLETEDPDEQIVVTLPCKHPFHEPCIIPWLKSSGTCPVCRFALVPQPNNHGSPTGPASPSTSFAGPSTSPPPPSPPSPPPSQEQGAGFIQSIFGAFGGHHHTTTNSSQSHRVSTASSSTHRSFRRRSTDDPRAQRSRRNNGSNDTLPGGWADDLD